jgi:hypothetical protein
MRSAATVVVAIGLALGAYTLGRQGRLERVQPPQAERPVEKERESVRLIVRQELARAARDVSLPASSPPVAEEARSPEALEPPPAPPAEEALRAVAQGHELISAASAARRWTDEDRTRLRSVLPLLTFEQREELFDELFPLINRGEIRLELAGPAL